MPYQLEGLDITMAAGGPMGSDTVTLFRKFFRRLPHARSFAEKHYKKPIEWLTKKKGVRWSSGDLGAVMYEIDKIKFED
jgi:hypothetical protein